MVHNGAPPQEPRSSTGRAGRRPVTTAAELERHALLIFEERGFDATTVDDIAAVAGIGRRTFFRYYASKNDVAWGEFDAHLETMRAALAATPAEVPVLAALRRAILDFNTYPVAEADWHRRRMALILRTPALQAHSTLRYAAWRAVVAEFVAARTGRQTDALEPRAVAWAFLGVAVAGYEEWLARPGADLGPILDQALRLLTEGLAETL
ncbi:mycofactocin system transcriptional regulator [Pseudofrankia inefficax]|uniref:Regulatory protein TetR n=1 Tax=Pseudofrankia inefficax (strain DSM 45817 / CECT 9037 / DDB 130130 / EuI1c) TaxID=298654 RepID=E3IY67_PSEI1|nr:regulatory protein TetR [Pseudofrankia inefficax]